MKGRDGPCAPNTRIVGCMRQAGRSRRSCGAILPNTTCALLAAGRNELSESQLLPTQRWATQQPANQSVLVNIGANTHTKTSGADPDPSLQSVRLGWRSFLIEPVPQNFEALQRTYWHEATEHPAHLTTYRA